MTASAPPRDIDAGKENPYLFSCGSWDFPADAMITSKLTSKAQTTIPQPVRAALRLKEGDEIAYTIEDGRVILTRAPSDAVEDPFGAFGEWATEADRRAYADL